MKSTRLTSTKIGEIHGNFTVIGEEYRKGRNVIVPIRCACGNELTLERGVLRANTQKGCIKCASITHGGTGTRLYGIWVKILDRIKHPTGDNICYAGLSVAEEWRDFANFREWSNSNGYADDLTIDREDNTIGYYPSNCRWTTNTVQSQNRRRSKRSSTGFKGVYYKKYRNGIKIYENTRKTPYYTIVIYQGKRTHISGFATAEEAYEARLSYINEHYKGLVLSPE